MTEKKKLIKQKLGIESNKKSFYTHRLLEMTKLIKPKHIINLKLDLPRLKESIEMNIFSFYAHILLLVMR